jgi:hypothetical protein
MDNNLDERHSAAARFATSQQHGAMANEPGLFPIDFQ